MGGNAAAIDRVTGQVLKFGNRPAYADRVDLNKVDRSTFKRDMVAAFTALNKLYDQKYDAPLWDADVFSELMKGEAFNGSSEHLFGDMDDEEFLKYKEIGRAHV